MGKKGVPMMEKFETADQRVKRNYLKQLRILKAKWGLETSIIQAEVTKFKYYF